MTDRILEVAESAARLHVRHAQLVVERDNGEEFTIPLEELAALVIAHPRVQMTQTVISGLANSGGTVVICDDKHLPTAMLLPLQAHSTQTERFARQAQISEPLRKRLWQQIVRSKVRAQSRLLLEIHGQDGGLGPMSARVRSGDTNNLEAQAARIYWPLLFNDPKFRRGREGPDQNQHLNYGYAVLRALVARALCAAGLHPSLGLQHHNRYNPFCLAADLMEPFRPIVDRSVSLWVRDNDPTQPLDRNAKAWLLRPFTQRFVVENEARTIFDVLARTASEMAGVIMGKTKALEIPDLPPPLDMNAAP